MYVTRPLSHYINSPESLSLPPEGPNSGYLVIQDEEAELYRCFGLCKERDLVNLPFPQNKNLSTRFSSGSGFPQNKNLSTRFSSGSGFPQNKNLSTRPQHTSYHDVVFIPVLNQPLSYNRYYAIEPHGSHIGEAYACSTEEDMATCCFCRCIRDAKPRPLDPHDTYQQFEIGVHETICNAKGGFYANPVAHDSFPPNFLRRKGWNVQTKTPKNYELGEAAGLNSALRASFPDVNIPVSYKSSNAVTVGKWYCPFMFVKDGTLRNQVKKSMFYEMTLEQRWEQIFERDNDYSNRIAVTIDVVVQNEVVLVAGREAVWDEKNVVDRAIWFKSFGSGGEEVIVGLSLEIVERMKWEEARVGWVGGEGRQVRVNRAEELGGGADGWRKFGCYILVERFVLKRMDGSLVMTYDFKHTHQLKSIWE